jgi:Xaa-Pro aminopeptidase
VSAGDADVGRRRDALATALAEQDLDAALVASRGNFTYLSGYVSPTWPNVARPMALLVTADGHCAALVGEGEAQAVAALAPGAEPVVYREPRSHGSAAPNFADALVDALAGHLGDRPLRRLAIELEPPSPPGLVPAALERLRERLGADLQDVGRLLWPLRERKSAYEIGRMRAAAQALGRAYDAFAAEARPGMSERELARAMTAAAAREADQVGYLVVVAGAGNAPLAPPTERVWERGELLLVDTGVLVDGYWADLSRHFAAGEPTAAQESAYARVVEAQRRGRAAVREGVSPAAVAVEMAAVLPPGTGFGRFGHGIGVEITEPPSLHASEEEPLPAGATLCVEPSAAFDDAGFLVGEEMVAVTEGGAELLSPPFPERLPRAGG